MSRKLVLTKTFQRKLSQKKFTYPINRGFSNLSVFRRKQYKQRAVNKMLFVRCTQYVDMIFKTTSTSTMITQKIDDRFVRCNSDNSNNSSELKKKTKSASINKTTTIPAENEFKISKESENNPVSIRSVFKDSNEIISKCSSERQKNYKIMCRKLAETAQHFRNKELQRTTNMTQHFFNELNFKKPTETNPDPDSDKGSVDQNKNFELCNHKNSAISFSKSFNDSLFFDVKDVKNDENLNNQMSEINVLLESTPNYSKLSSSEKYVKFFLSSISTKFKQRKTASNEYFPKDEFSIDFSKGIIVANNSVGTKTYKALITKSKTEEALIKIPLKEVVRSFAKSKLQKLVEQKQKMKSFNIFKWENNSDSKLEKSNDKNKQLSTTVPKRHFSTSHHKKNVALNFSLLVRKNDLEDEFRRNLNKKCENNKTMKSYLHPMLRHEKAIKQFPSDGYDRRKEDQHVRQCFDYSVSCPRIFYEGFELMKLNNCHLIINRRQMCSLPIQNEEKKQKSSDDVIRKDRKDENLKQNWTPSTKRLRNLMEYGLVPNRKNSRRLFENFTNELYCFEPSVSYDGFKLETENHENESVIYEKSGNFKSNDSLVTNIGKLICTNENKVILQDGKSSVNSKELNNKNVSDFDHFNCLLLTTTASENVEKMMRSNKSSQSTSVNLPPEFDKTNITIYGLVPLKKKIIVVTEQYVIPNHVFENAMLYGLLPLSNKHYRKNENLSNISVKETFKISKTTIDENLTNIDAILKKILAENNIFGQMLSKKKSITITETKKVKSTRDSKRKEIRITSLSMENSNNNNEGFTTFTPIVQKVIVANTPSRGNNFNYFVSRFISTYPTKHLILSKSNTFANTKLTRELKCAKYSSSCSRNCKIEKEKTSDPYAKEHEKKLTKLDSNCKTKESEEKFPCRVCERAQFTTPEMKHEKWRPVHFTIKRKKRVLVKASSAKCTDRLSGEDKSKIQKKNE